MSYRSIIQKGDEQRPRQWGCRFECGAGCGPQSRFHLWVQARLAKSVGSWVPQTGKLGQATRRAIAVFQAQNQLPGTGLLDTATVTALRAEKVYPAHDYARSGSPFEGDHLGFLSGKREDETEQEFRLTGECQVTVTWQGPFDLDKESGWNFPKGPGLYVIKLPGGCWYVGKADAGLRKRFQARHEALKDFNIPISGLKGRQVYYAILNPRSCKGMKVERRDRKQREQFEPVDATLPVLGVLESFYIDRYQTKNRGNSSVEPVNIAESTGKITLLDPGPSPCGPPVGRISLPVRRAKGQPS